MYKLFLQKNESKVNSYARRTQVMYTFYTRFVWGLFDNYWDMYSNFSGIKDYAGGSFVKTFYHCNITEDLMFVDSFLVRVI